MVRIFLLLSSILFSGALFAQTSCHELLTRQQKTSYVHQDVYQNNHFKYEGTLKGQYGGKKVRIRLQDPQAEWKMPKITDEDNAPPGNLMLLFKTMPVYLKDFLGFKALDENYNELPAFTNRKPSFLELPDVFEINGALKRLDKILKSNGYFGIPLRFYLESEITSDRSFVEMYVRYSGLPYSKDSSISYHDLNYHLLPIFMFTERMYSDSQRMSEVFLKFADWLVQKHPQAATESALAGIYHIRAHHIDLTGNLSIYLSSPLAPKSIDLGYSASKSFVGAGLSPFEYLSAVIKYKLKDPKNVEFRTINIGHLEEFRSTLEPKFFVENQDMRTLIKDEEELYSAYNYRLMEIQLALLGIPKKP